MSDAVNDVSTEVSAPAVNTAPLPRKVWFTLGRFTVHKPRPPKRYLREIARGEAVFPLVLLFFVNAVVWMDQTAFGLLAPDIRDSFHMTDKGILTLISLTLLGGLLIQVPLAYYSDRLPRVRMAIVGAVIWAVFGVFTGLSFTILTLVLARSGSGIGRAVVEPTQNSLLSDYYPVEARADVYGFHRISLAVGSFFGPIIAGVLAHYFSWRVPFVVFAVPTLVFVFLAFRLHEPKRGAFERQAMGAEDAIVQTDEVPPSFAESTRILWQVRTLRRIWFSLPFLAAVFLGLAALTSLFYEQVYNLDTQARGFLTAFTEPAQLIGILVGIPIATRAMLKDPALVLRLLAVVGLLVAGAIALFALSPTLWVAFTMQCLFTALAALLAPGVFAVLSLTMPPKVRSLGYSMASLFILPGVLALQLVGWIADNWGIRQGIMIMVPIVLIGAWTLSSASFYVKSDINRVWTSTFAQAEVAYQRKQGLAKLLLVRNLDVAYDGVQVLFGVNFEVDEGEIVALLGTNGAGKSTLIKAICGLVEATNGAIIFDGRDATYAPPYEVAARGIVQVPGGQGVFPSLTVEENLRMAAWLQRHDPAVAKASTERVLDRFPVLRNRLQEPAANLSGGQQQMLTLGMAFITKPRLLMIDELSLGLAPTIVADLLEVVRELREQGTTIILVEQSVNVALTVAETAYFMEKGEIRFHGNTAELLDRPDVLRSVFLEGAATATGPVVAENGGAKGNGGGDRDPDAPRVRIAEPGAAATPGANGSGNGQEEDAPAHPRLLVESVSKRFGGISALDDVSFSVAPREVVGFIGPNGAGKTTLFDVLCGYQPDDGGHVELDGISLTSRSPDARARLGLGRSFQDGRLFPALTVAETIAVALERSVDVRDPILAALNLPVVADSEEKVSQRVDELIDVMHLGAFRDKFVRELSTGSRRIVDLACVLAHQPTVLLLDEPSSGIAQREAEALGPLLLRIRDLTGASVLIIEHDVPLLSSISDRVIALDLGEVIAIGTPEEVVRDPRVVASYLGQSEDVIARSGARIGGGSSGGRNGT
jgi:ABC-type branched-subunit amino acid transport system ATPase component/predicted MFS family arabinose efflux permease